MNKIRENTIYSTFKCIGGQCEDSCCEGWTVDIDQETYGYLKGIKNHELKNRIQDKIYLNEWSYSQDVDYAHVELNKKKACAFLNKRKLCDLQTAFGEKGISNVCNLFPRTLNKVNGVIERTLSMACPEAARLVLKNKKAIQYQAVRENLKHVIIETELLTNDLQYKDTAVKYFMELRCFSIELIQNKNIDFKDRILMLGAFHQELEKSKNDAILALIDQWRRDILHKKTRRLSQKKSTLLLLKIADALDVKKEVDNERFKDFHKLFRKGIKYSGYDHYRLVKEKNMDQLKDKMYILENYLVNDMYRNLYPFSEPGSPMDSYRMLMTKLGLIELYLMGISESLNGLEEDTIVDFIQAFSKTVDHHHTYLESISDLLESTVKIEFALMD